MEIGAKVTAEIMAHGKPERIHGTVVGSRAGEHDVLPDGFETLTVTVPSKHVHARKPEGIVQPKLDYKKK